MLGPAFKKRDNIYFLVSFRLCLHCWIAFVPARNSYWIGLRFIHKNGDFGAISVTERSCAAPRQSLKWRDAYRIGVHAIPDSFCAGTKTIPHRASVYTHKNSDFGAISVTERSCAAPRRANL